MKKKVLTTKKELIELLDLIKDDSEILAFFYKNNVGNTSFSSKKILKEEILKQLTEEKDELRFKKNRFDEIDKEEIMIGSIGVSTRSLYINIHYETLDIEDYYECRCQYYPDYKVYIKLDKENKLITFKLGNKEKTLEIITGSEYVMKPYRMKYLKCVSLSNLEKFIKDDFWRSRVLSISREKILKFNN